jgi:hypothetical protein
MYKAFIGALGALFGFIIVSGFYYWWHLLRMFHRYKKGVDDISKSQFYTFLVLNYFVLLLISSFTLSFLLIGQPIIVAILILQIIPLIISYLIYRKYRKINSSNNDIITKTENIDL